MMMTLSEFLKKFPSVKNDSRLNLTRLQGLQTQTEREREIGRQVLQHSKKKQ